VLVKNGGYMVCDGKVSVAGCLGYDVLDGKLYYETNHDQDIIT
jgi:exopolysaccharide biosynthesis protein